MSSDSLERQWRLDNWGLVFAAIDKPIAEFKKYVSATGDNIWRTAVDPRTGLHLVHHLILRQDTEKIEALCAAGLNLDTMTQYEITDTLKNTPNLGLGEFCVQKRKFQSLAKLLENGIPNPKSTKYSGPNLHEVVMRGEVWELKLMLEKGVNVDEKAIPTEFYGKNPEQFDATFPLVISRDYGLEKSLLLIAYGANTKLSPAIEDTVVMLKNHQTLPDSQLAELAKKKLEEIEEEKKASDPKALIANIKAQGTGCKKDFYKLHEMLSKVHSKVQLLNSFILKLDQLIEKARGLEDSKSKLIDLPKQKKEKEEQKTKILSDCNANIGKAYDDVRDKITLLVKSKPDNLALVSEEGAKLLLALQTIETGLLNDAEFNLSNLNQEIRDLDAEIIAITAAQPQNKAALEDIPSQVDAVNVDLMNIRKDVVKALSFFMDSTRNFTFVEEDLIKIVTYATSDDTTVAIAQSLVDYCDAHQA